MAPRKTPKVQSPEEGFRRTDDIERLAKLEYVVYEDHDPLLVEHSHDIKFIAETQAKIGNHLKNIRNILMAFFIGAVGSQVGWEKAAKLIALLLA
jgi:hypothetical protein